jgi:hypothetical protein
VVAEGPWDESAVTFPNGSVSKLSFICNTEHTTRQGTIQAKWYHFTGTPLILGNSVELEALLMNFNEMRSAGYPVHLLHDDGLPDPEFVYTPSKTEQSAGQRTVIGMDCEMCRTDQGMEVTRVTLVDYQGNTLFDQLVKPANPILDYLTTYLLTAISLIIVGLA